MTLHPIPSESSLYTVQYEKNLAFFLISVRWSRPETSLMFKTILIIISPVLVTYPIPITTSLVQNMLLAQQYSKIRNKYSHERNCAVTVPIASFIFLWAIYLFLWPVCCRKIGGPNVGIYRIYRWMWKLGLRPRNSFSWNTLIRISLQGVSSYSVWACGGGLGFSRNLFHSGRLWSTAWRSS